MAGIYVRYPMNQPVFSQEVAPASDALTLTNGPVGSAGNPATYLVVNVNGTNYVIPAWPYTP